MRTLKKEEGHGSLFPHDSVGKMSIERAALKDFLRGGSGQDPSWKFIDENGKTHQILSGRPASPRSGYLPSLLTLELQKVALKALKIILNLLRKIPTRTRKMRDADAGAGSCPGSCKYRRILGKWLVTRILTPLCSWRMIVRKISVRLEWCKGSHG